MSLIDRMNEWVKRYYGWLFAGAFVLALFLRFISLGKVSLSDSEAAGALQALSIARGQGAVVGGAPGYVGLTSLLFFLFDGSDFLARFWPALFGSALVLLPCLFHKYLQDLPGVLLAFLFAFEPGLVALSRTADGTIITIFSLLAAAGFFLNRKMVPAGIFAGLALIGSPQFWPFAFILAFAGFLTYIAGRQTTETENDIEDKPLFEEKPKWWLLSLSALITIFIISSQFFLYPRGVSGIGSGVTEYLASWNRADSLPLGTFLLVQLFTQFPAIVLGIWGLINGLKERNPLFRFLGLWWIIGLILWAINPSLGTQDISVINLPLYVLAAMQVVHFVEKVLIRSWIVALAEALVTVCLIIFSLLNFLNLVGLTVADPVTERNRIIGTLLPIVLWIVFSLLLAWGWDIASTNSGLAIGIGLLLAALLLGSAWKAADLGSRPENELLSGMEYISGKSELMQTVKDVSRWNTGQADSIDVKIAGLQLPSLDWNFRNFRKLSVDTVFPEDSKSSIILSGPDSIVRSQTDYRGSLIIWSREPDYSQFKWQDWFKWFFLREVPQKNQAILLWVRNDLFKDVSSQSQTP